MVQAVFERPAEDGGRAEVLVRREVAAQGRSRAFLDDALVTTGALREWGQSVIDLHGQHDHHRLLDPAAHVDVLDSFARHPERVEATSLAYAAWPTTATRLERMSDGEKQARIEIARFHLEEASSLGRDRVFRRSVWIRTLRPSCSASSVSLR